MPGQPPRRHSLLLPLLPALALLTACALVRATSAPPAADLEAASQADSKAQAAPARGHRRNDRAPHGDLGDLAETEGRAGPRSDQFQLISTSNGPPPAPAPAPPPAASANTKPEEKVASSDLPAADKQYEYPLVRPVYAPFVTRPASYAVPYVEILDHHHDPPFVTSKPTQQHYVGSPMVSTVVVQDLSQTPHRPVRPVLDEGSVSLVSNIHHLGPTKIPFTDVQVVTKPLGKPDTKGEPGYNPNFTDKVEETSLEYDSDEEDEEDDDDTPKLNLGGIVEDVVQKVFRENPVLDDAHRLLPRPAGGWPCPPVTCCSRPPRPARPGAPAGPGPQVCSTFVKCVTGRSPACPLRAERVPQALALSKPANGQASQTNATDPDADLRDGEPRFKKKKKKLLKKKKKLLKKFMLPLLIAYKLLFIMVVPMMVNGMMMMMSSSGMAGFFFALIGASVTMVRVMGSRAPPAPPSKKVVKVIQFVQPSTPPAPPPPSTTAAPTPSPPTVIHHQPFVEEHFPTYHAPHPPSYGSYYPPPYWTRHYDRSEGALDGGRKRRRRIDASHMDESNLNGILVNAGDNELWIV